MICHLLWATRYKTERGIGGGIGEHGLLGLGEGSAIKLAGGGSKISCQGGWVQSLFFSPLATIQIYLLQQ